MPAVRVTYKDHPDDLATARFIQARSAEIMDAAGALKVINQPIKKRWPSAPPNTSGASLGRMRYEKKLSPISPGKRFRTFRIPTLASWREPIRSALVPGATA
jgi:hypothetical protein